MSAPLGRMGVPRLPDIDPAAVAQHDEAHATLAAAHDAAPPEVRAVFAVLARRVLIESLAYIQPIRMGNAEDQLLFPAPRAYLTARQRRRIEGATAAFQHLDVRAAMTAMGAIPSSLGPETPLVLHALIESRSPSGKDANAGLVRATPTHWKPEVNQYGHPPASECPGLLAAAVHTAATGAAPACVRAAWLTFTMLSIHPFVDGNGRTCRALYLAVAADALPLGIDWGILEQWALGRDAYVAALQAGQRIAGYDADLLDARPFTELSVAASTLGAGLSAARLTMLERAVAELIDGGLGADAAMLVSAVRLLRIATLDELRPMVASAADLDAHVAELLGAGVLRWAPRPFGRRTPEQPEEFGLVAVAAGPG